MPYQAPDFSFAFQPIVDAVNRSVFSYEILVRGSRNEPAYTVLETVPDSERDHFQQLLRETSLKMARCLEIPCNLNLNFLPESLYGSENNVQSTLQTAVDMGFEPQKVIIEVTEVQVISQPELFIEYINQFRGKGIKVAIDDFGAGYSGLNLLADFQPDMVKLDMHLIRNIHEHGPKQAITRAIYQVCFDLGIDLIAEGVETLAEFNWLAELGVELFQGYLMAKPGFERLPEVFYPELP